MAIAWLERKRARRGWVGLFVAGAAVAAFAILDYDFWDTSDQGIVLRDRDWSFEAGDFPGTWGAVEASAVYQRVSEKAPELRPKLDAWMRSATGIRWTPTRWNLWFGRVLLVSGKGEDAVLCVRETLMLRGALALASVAGLSHDRNGVLDLSGVYCAREGGLLLVGTNPDLVSQARENGERWSSVGGRSIVVERTTGRKFSLVFAEPEWDSSIGGDLTSPGEFAGQLRLEGIEHRPAQRPEYFSMQWPQHPIISITTRGLEPDAIVPRDEWPDFPGSADLKKAWDDFEKLLPVNWREGADTTQFALFDVDTSETVPVPDAAVFARSEEVLGPLTPPVNAIPYEWSGASGWMTPWLGEGMNLFVAADDRSRVFANQEATMARVMGQRRQGRIASDDARIEIDAGRLAQVLTDVVRRAAKDELLPERNADDVEADVVPWLKALGALGEIRLSGKYDADGLTLRGETSPPVEQESPR